MLDNIILNTDSYKASHWLQMPPKTEYQSSYIESRGGKWNRTVFFGLQMFLKKYLSKPITQEMIDEAETFWKAHGEPFNREGWQYILNEYNGYLPVSIEAVPEGTVVPVSNVLVQMVNTDPKCYWLTSYLETSLLRAIWYPTTVATNSYMCKEIIYEGLKKSSDNPDEQISFKLHDFGARGVSILESASIGGAAHLINFMGTDTVSGAIAAHQYYGEPMAGFSIPASEHSTMTTWGGEKGEIKAFENMLDQFAKPGVLVACVSDSYNIFEATRNKWGRLLKEKIIKSGATLIVRPDSGDPTQVPLRVIETLMDSFGYTWNNKGYRVLPSYIRVIQGDGINHSSIKQIIDNMLELKLSIDNIAFGMGGGLLQELNRDTLEFAMKCSAIKINGLWLDVYKKPITDSKKNSKRGRLALVKGYNTVKADSIKYGDNLMEEVFRNGKLLKTSSFKEIRERANI